MTAVLIATSAVDGARWLRDQPAPPLRAVIVTPRTPKAARGVTADAVFATPAARACPQYDEMLAEAMPAVLARR